MLAQHIEFLFAAKTKPHTPKKMKENIRASSSGFFRKWKQRYGAFPHAVMTAILVFPNNETAAMLVFKTSPVWVELFSRVNAFFSHKFA